MAKNDRASGERYLDRIFVGIVKQNYDPKRAGRIKVWIPEQDGSEFDETAWITCDYCSPFAGATNRDKNSRQIVDTQQDTQTSYGFWAVPPDINNEVLVVFASGKINHAFWIGSLFKEYMLHEIPGNAASPKNKQLVGTINAGQSIPVSEYNKWDATIDAKDELSPVRPWQETRTRGIGAQGLIKDKLRGTTTSSAMRESPSQVFGISTPGPIDPRQSNPEKGIGRLGGSTFVMDDGDSDGNDEHIGFRTRTGAMIRIDETDGMIYAINKKGTSWIQMDADGNVDIFGAKSISMRTQENFNVRADGDINLEAGQNINMKAAQDTDADKKYVGEGNGIGGNIKTQSVNDIHTEVKGNVYFTVTDGNLNIDVQTGTKDEHVAGDVKFTTDANLDETITGNDKHTVTGNYDLDVTGDINIEGNNVNSKALAETNIQSTGDTNLLGSSVNINSGGFAPGAEIATPANPTAAIPETVKEHTNVLKDFNGTTAVKYNNPQTIGGNNKKNTLLIPNYWDRNTESMDTIVKRLMTYEPCPEHTNKGNK